MKPTSQTILRSNHQTFTHITNRNQPKGKPPAGDIAILIKSKFIYHQVTINTLSIENTTIHIQVGNKELRHLTVYKRSQTQIITSDID